MRAKRLIVNADDFGLSRGITDGILRAHSEGIVTSTSLMVNTPASSYALERSRFAPHLGIGVHLNICEGRPILSPEEVPSLVTADGKFHNPQALIGKLYRCQLSFGELESEFRAQIQWAKSRGLTPTHVDSHHHMHMYPGAIVPFRRALLKEGVPRARSLRHRASPCKGMVGGPYAGSLIRRVAVGTYAELIQRFVLRGLCFPDSCIVQHSRFRGKLDLLSDGVEAILDSLPDGAYEMGCHPGLPEEGFSDTDTIRERREVELTVLTKPYLHSLIKHNGIELISYGEL
jgi:chitin disaccharide deacetylase